MTTPAQLKEQVKAMNTCKDCRWWELSDPGIGLCRRMPPHAVNWFPKTIPEDWCGEFTPKSLPPGIPDIDPDAIPPF